MPASGSSPSGGPVDFSSSTVAACHARCTLSRCPAPTKRTAPVDGTSSASAAVTYFSGAVVAYSSSLACAGQHRERPDAAEQRAQRRLHVAHHQRGRQTLARHVGDTQEHAAARSAIDQVGSAS